MHLRGFIGSAIKQHSKSNYCGGEWTIKISSSECLNVQHDNVLLDTSLGVGAGAGGVGPCFPSVLGARSMSLARRMHMCLPPLLELGKPGCLLGSAIWMSLTVPNPRRSQLLRRAFCLPVLPSPSSDTSLHPLHYTTTHVGP
ncbi:hypothetical protein ATANTOWER_029524 [Ataeniobius toweri]|uniref:Uncharacterized protein n=1 Tax=Ataeniobius toweri TaxID=208326 RepID=A0ABU7AJI0_9TELE|nr:hypothetical protein [Ataeniobius toweri]